MADEESRHGPGLADDERVAPVEPGAGASNGEFADAVGLDDPASPTAPTPASANGDDAATDPITTESVGDAPDAGNVADAGDASDAAAPADGTESPPSDIESPAPAPATQRPHWLFGRQRTGEKKHKKAPWWELPLLIAVAIAVAVLIKTFLVQPFYIPSESMERTLHGCAGCSGDRVLVNKVVYDLRDPHPGDIAVFRAPPDWDEEASPRPPSNPIVKGVRWFGQLIGFVPPDEKDLIKRVIAVGGQTVQCCDAQGRVQVSDHGTAGPWHSLNEPYIFENSPWDPRDRPGHIVAGSNDQRTFGPITIPKGRLWVMGDHRNDSADSRYHCIQEASADHICGTAATTVAVDKVIGKAVLIAWPPSRWRTLGTPPSFTQAVAVLPALGATAVVLPLFGVRRRRRR